MSIYRTPAAREERVEQARSLDGAELSIVGVLFFVSAARVLAAGMRHETFGAEATLALLVLVGLLIAAGHALARHVASTRSRC